ncbi:MAG: alpha/beta fold hydrolase [Mycobacteriales bacterium]
MRGEEFSAPTAGGHLGGWVQGAGEPVLVLHGGPGMDAAYLEPVVEELAAAYRVALFQQRGLSPSTTSGPFDVATAVSDVAAVMDHLEIERAYVVGHSWGGHLALHVAARLPRRLRGALCLDPLGAVGDGGAAGFEAEMSARVPAEVWSRASELDARAMSGEGTDEDAVEALRLVWPGYFADPAAAPPMPEDMRVSAEANGRLWESVREEMPGLETALPTIGVPVGFLVAGAGPIATSASTDSAKRIPGAWVEVLDGAGHMFWTERPGCVVPALARLEGR